MLTINKIYMDYETAPVGVAHMPDVYKRQVPNYGYAAAVSYVLLVIIVLITIVQKKVTGDHDE